jgi:hypothetical protein
MKTAVREDTAVQEQDGGFDGHYGGYIDDFRGQRILVAISIP